MATPARRTPPSTPARPPASGSDFPLAYDTGDGYSLIPDPVSGPTLPRHIAEFAQRQRQAIIETAPDGHGLGVNTESAPELKAPESQPEPQHEPDPQSQPDPESVLRLLESVQTAVASESPGPMPGDSSEQPPPKQPPPKHVKTKKGNAATSYLRSLQSEERYTQITFEATKGVIRLNRFAQASKGIGDVITICLAYTDGSGDFWVKARQLREDLGMPNTKRNRKRVNQYVRILKEGLDFGEGPIPAFVEYQGKKWVNGRHKTFTIKRWQDDFLTALDHLGRITIEDESLSAAERGRLGKGVRKQRGMGVSS